MARNLFGGTAADVAEDVDGARIPGAVGTVWNGISDGATQILDLTDADGAPIVQLVADQRGFVPAFYGPNNVERLWVDFGNGKIGLTSSTVGERLAAHQVANDPHQDRAYVDEKLSAYMLSSGGEYNVTPTGGEWQRWVVPTTPDTTGLTWKQATADGTQYTRLTNAGALFIDTVGKNVPLGIGAPGYSANGVVINVSNSKSSSTLTNSVFSVRGDGSVVTAGSVTATGSVTASNVGNARVFSGPNAPASPQAGDVWIQYA
ncbi:hypothetical protein [Streptomyces californicus]|uniref:hypothetical protein n=1 Tax=Streptomyces californicus TaxID=67351 RepID=UPI0036CB6660